MVEGAYDAESESEVATDDPLHKIGTDTGMDTVLKSTSSITKAEALLLIMCHAASHNVTGCQLDDLLKLINFLFGNEVVPRSKHMFSKVFKNNSEIVDFHLYCKGCKSHIGTQKLVTEQNITQCPSCNEPVEINSLNNSSFFINVPIAPQIQNLLENPEIQKHINYRFDRPHSVENAISDIYDGVMYKKLSQPNGILSDPNNFSYNFNSDGSPLYKSSKFSIWPIQLHLNELPPQIRFKHVILAGLWFGKHEPAMQVYLKPFTEQAKSLVSKGVFWRRNGVQLNSKIVGICCCVDSKARPSMQNTTQFNGYYGCGFCLHPGVLVERQVKYTVLESQPDDRDSESMMRDMEAALVEGRSVRGVKGPSHLINMPNFDIVWGFVPDYMHAVLLGVIRQLTELLLQSTDQPYYIGRPDTLRIIENRIRNIQPPHLISRLPRPLEEFRYWKASEWRAWLLFYCLPCLEGVLESRYLKHLSLLVSSIFLLLQQSITCEEVNKADVMLLEFVIKFQLLYGETAMTFNVHLLTHLAKSVKLWGPLWAHSAFVFESANGNLLKLFHGTKSVAVQIVNKFLLHKAVASFTTKHVISDRVLNFYRECTEYPRVQKCLSWQETTVLDSGTTKQLTDEEKNAFMSAQIQVPETVLTHNRMIHKGLIYTSRSYCRSKRRRECCVGLTNGCQGEIQNIISFETDEETEIALLCKIFHTQPTFPLNPNPGFVPHIKLIADSHSPLCLFSTNSIRYKCFNIVSSDKIFVCDFPNVYERD